MSFGKKLLTLRVTNNLNQNEMARKLNVSQPVYSRYENDEKDVTENDPFVKRVAEEFDATRKWLLNDDDTSSIEPAKSKGNPNSGTTDNYYSLPKDFMDVYFKQQQQMLEQILSVVVKK